MSGYAFDFLNVEMRPSKPRQTGLTAVRDRMRSIQEQRAFLETYAPFVEFAKISNLAPRFYSEDFLRAKLSLYAAHDVMPFFGGILFENAVAQGQAERLLSYLSELGAPAIEISNNILDLSTSEMSAYIKRFAGEGATIFVEWGEKYPSTPLNPDSAAGEMQTWLGAGARYVILERSEIDLLLEEAAVPDGMARLSSLADLIGHDRLMFEAESQAQCVSLLNGLGRDVSLGPNIDFELIKWLEPSRVGVSREMGHATIEAAAGREAVRSRLN